MKSKRSLSLVLLIFVMSFVSESFCQNSNQKLIYNYEFSPIEGIVNKVESKYRNEICLNGYWDFQPISLPNSYVYGKGVAPMLTMPKDGNWCSTRIKIPSPWNINAFANRNVEGPDHRNYPSYPKEWENVKMAWMKKSVKIPNDWNGMQIELHFEAVAGFAEVYVNKKKVGENFDLFLPFDINITDNVKAGESIEILVGVRSQSLFEDNSTVGRRIVPAGSMWGYLVSGIWQDVYLIALPKTYIENVYVKPLLSKGLIEVDATIINTSNKKEIISINGDICEWINRAGNEINNAPVPNWDLSSSKIQVTKKDILINPQGSNIVKLQIPVKDGELKEWEPNTPNLYALLLTVKRGKEAVDLKYERFGWREWTIKGDKHYLNGKEFKLKGDSWHFMGVPQMTRRYAWAWYKAIKDINGNAVRLHAQVYPILYLDMADELGICVLDETANWASDGGPKLDSERFWNESKKHLKRFVLRDRNHPSVFGWSMSNENKPVILNVFKKPELLPQQMKAWEEWRDIIRENDSTRPWISADGEDDGDGILPVTVGHYGDLNSMKRWKEIGKPWGIGEHSMAYYGTPLQVSKYNGERAYESQLGRMEGLANECYNLIKEQRLMGASYSTVFNMVWYALKPLPLGKRDITTSPTLDDGIFFKEYIEGKPGIQPERVGPYCTTFNPGYDPNLPLYDAWPMFGAMRAANANDESSWSRYADEPKSQQLVNANAHAIYKNVVFVGNQDSYVKKALLAQGVNFGKLKKDNSNQIIIIDGSYILSDVDIKIIRESINNGSDIWLWGLTKETLNIYNKILPKKVELYDLFRSSFIPRQKSWASGLKNSDMYFCEIQNDNASKYSLGGEFVEEGEVLIDACRTDWRKWNKRPEELKTASVLRSENETTVPTPTFVKYNGGTSTFYVSTIDNFTNTQKGFNMLSKLLFNAGISCSTPFIDTERQFSVSDNKLKFPNSINNGSDSSSELQIEVYSTRPLDDLLIEPNMPRLDLVLSPNEYQLAINGKSYDKYTTGNSSLRFEELPLKQGWNIIIIKMKQNTNFRGYFECKNSNNYINTLMARIKTN